MNVGKLDQAQSWPLTFCTFHALVKRVKIVVILQILWLVMQNPHDIIVSIERLVARVFATDADLGAKVVRREDHLAEIVEEAGHEMMGEAFAGGEVEAEAP